MVDPAVAKRVIDRRWPDARLARNSIRDEEYVAEQLDLARLGITHDERIVELYAQERLMTVRPSEPDPYP